VTKTSSRLRIEIILTQKATGIAFTFVTSAPRTTKVLRQLRIFSTTYLATETSASTLAGTLAARQTLKPQRGRTEHEDYHCPFNPNRTPLTIGDYT